jgi:DNA phosphorothioation-associated putative methyltransferase
MELDNAAELDSLFGSVRRAFQVVRRVTGTEQWEAIFNERKTDLLVYVALGRFPRRPIVSSLPRALQLDIKAFFGTYKAACLAGDALLFEAGDMNKVDTACSEAEFGKLMPAALYVHVSGLNRLAPILRVYEGCAKVLSGQIEGTAIIKLRRNEPKISYLGYPQFDSLAHPTLSFSVRVDLRTFGIRHREFVEAPNPPILHRKEEFVPADYLERALFAQLTRAEEEAGLFANPSEIGMRDAWQQRLQRLGLVIMGHELKRQT